jgi:hypothetical protein
MESDRSEVQLAQTEFRAKESGRAASPVMRKPYLVQVSAVWACRPAR